MKTIEKWISSGTSESQEYQGAAVLSVIHRDGNAEKWTFDWVIAPPKYGREVVKWTGGLHKKYSKFYFGH